MSKTIQAGICGYVLGSAPMVIWWDVNDHAKWGLAFDIGVVALAVSSLIWLHRRERRG